MLYQGCMSILFTILTPSLADLLGSARSRSRIMHVHVHLGRCASLHPKSGVGEEELGWKWGWGRRSSHPFCCQQDSRRAAGSPLILLKLNLYFSPCSGTPSLSGWVNTVGKISRVVNECGWLIGYNLRRSWCFDWRSAVQRWLSYICRHDRCFAIESLTARLAFVRM